MRLAVIGCGFFAQNHLNGWRDLAADGVQLVAVCDINQRKAEEVAKTFAVPRFYAEAGALLGKEKAGGIIFFGIDATWSIFVTGAVIIVAAVLDRIVKYRGLQRAAAQRLLDG